MTLKIIAAAINEAFYDGRDSSSDERMTDEDFLQFVYAEFGGIAVIEYYNQMRAGNAEFYFSKMIKSAEFDIKEVRKGVGRAIIGDYVNMPYLAGILAVYPLTKDGSRDFDEDYVRMKPGAESIYCKPAMLEDIGKKYYVPKGNGLDLYGGQRDGKLGIEYMPLDDKTDVPEGIGKIIMEQVLKLLGPESVRPVDTTENNDPNIQTYKQRLDQPQDI